MCQHVCLLIGQIRIQSSGAMFTPTLMQQLANCVEVGKQAGSDLPLGSDFKTDFCQFS